MARWKLNQKHYLNSPGNEWEYRETDAASGRETRLRLPVPRLLDPNDPNDWTDKSEAIVVVCYEGKGQRRDITFSGQPTPDMEPLDEEAEKISKALEGRWASYGAMPEMGMDYSMSIISKLTDQIDMMSRPQTQSLSGVSQEDFKALQDKVARLMAENVKLRDPLG